MADADRDWVPVAAALLGAAAAFLATGVGTFFVVARSAGQQLVRGGQISMAAGMAGLFVGGFVALLVFVGVYRWISSLSRPPGITRAGRNG